MIAILLLSAPFLSIGENPLSREIISYDAQMPHLESSYAVFAKQVSAETPLNDILSALCHFVREELFELKSCNETQVRLLVGDQRQVPLDNFVEAKIGVCRHFALATHYFLERLIDDGIIAGKCYIVRGFVQTQGKHAWNILETKDSKWHLDTFWNIHENIDL